MATPASDTRFDYAAWDGISCDASVVSGTPVFRGTRVPVASLFDYLLHNKRLDEFYDDFPSVTPEHVRAVLRSAQDYVSQPIFPSRDGTSRGE